jgi:hypothetical protein
MWRLSQRQGDRVIAECPAGYKGCGRVPAYAEMTPAIGAAFAAEETFGMSSDEAATTVDGGASKAGVLPFDTSVAHQARVYDYLFGGKDNISQ